MKNLLGDCIWVLGALLRGKILRQKKYRPHKGEFPLKGATTRRRILFMLCWGYYPMSMKEMVDIQGSPRQFREQDWVDCGCGEGDTPILFRPMA